MSGDGMVRATINSAASGRVVVSREGASRGNADLCPAGPKSRRDGYCGRR
jgi:hypothetical protein